MYMVMRSLLCGNRVCIINTGVDNDDNQVALVVSSQHCFSSLTVPLAFLLFAIKNKFTIFKFFVMFFIFSALCLFDPITVLCSISR